MPPRRGRGRTVRRSVEDVQQNIPLRLRERHAEVEDVTRQIGEMELVLARFQRKNPPTFIGAEGGLLAEGWLEHMEGLFDTLEYTTERRLKLAILQLREHAQRWWKGTSRVMRETGVLRSSDLSSSAEHDVVINDIIIDGPLRCSSWFSFDVPADPSSSSSASSWFLSYQLIHYAPSGST
ncbi:hypothetical protein F511_39400 [Dorcoceras hygrometricum]|uniref:Uncharacterized protein n=1 Tax=Dorcoceras hygrometricum TaxID=472368 RepID=A0A2Z7BQ48_9LAMI|nr:hypothetical protein F511_39400 [Dorcoceras hygrometricum]